MAITESESGAELKSGSGHGEVRFAEPGTNSIGMVDGYTRNYWTEVCSLELLFSEYIQSIIPAAESLEAAQQVASSDIDRIISVIRGIREWVISYLHVQIKMAPSDVDPFFVEQPMPEIYAVRESEFKPSTVMPLGDYVKRSSKRYPDVIYASIIEDVSDALFKVGMSSRSADEGKHYLLLPDPIDLLCATRDRVLFSIGSF